jgi:hypothetical protein
MSSRGNNPKNNNGPKPNNNPKNNNPGGGKATQQKPHPQQQPQPPRPAPAPVQLLPILPPGTTSIVPPFQITTNCFETTLDPKLLRTVYQYSVTFEPELSNQVSKRRIFYNSTLLASPSYLEWLAFDGGALAFSFTEIPELELDFTRMSEHWANRRALYDEFGVLVQTVPKPPQKVRLVLVNKCLLANALALLQDENANHGGLVTAYGSSDSNASELRLGPIGLKQHLAGFVNLSLSTLFRHTSIVFALHSERNRVRRVITAKDPEMTDAVWKTNQQRILLSTEGFVSRHGCLYRLDRPDNFNAKNSLSGGLYGIQSAYSALRFLQGRIIFNVDVAILPTYQVGKTVVDILKEISGQTNLSAIPSSCYQHLLKCRAITNHLPSGSNSRIALQKVGPKVKDCPPFSDQDGKKQTVASYFKQKYQKVLNLESYTYVTEKILHTKDGKSTKQTLYHPVEVLTLYSVNNSPTQNINPEQIKSILNLMTIPPKETLAAATEQLVELNKAIKYLQQETPGSAAVIQPGSTASIYSGITINSTPLRARARLLPPPSLKFGNEEVVARDGSFTPSPKHTWFAPGSDAGEVRVVRAVLTRCDRSDDYFNDVLTFGKQRGLNLQFDNTELIYTANSRTDKSSLNAVEQWCKRIGQAAVTNRKKYLILILVDANSEYYPTIKRVCETSIGLMTQFADARKISNNYKKGGFAVTSYMHNILLKVNSKLGGLNYQLKSQQTEHNPILYNSISPKFKVPHETISKEAPISVFGIDVFHALGKRSHAGVVGSWDSNLSRYNGYLIQQPKAQGGKAQTSQETLKSNTVQEAFFHLMLQFASCQSKPSLPQHIIIYRDGVSDSQIKLSMEQEIPGIISAVHSAYLTLFPTSTYKYNPTITFLIAVKRHHIFLVPDPGHEDRLGRDKTTNNVRAGTVVDTTIGRQDISEFYLQGHASALGTGKCTAYQVVYSSDQAQVSMDSLQLLTNFLSYGHQRAYKATRIPTPVYFADLLCYRGRVYAKPESSDGSWDQNELPEGLKKKHFWL